MFPALVCVFETRSEPESAAKAGFLFWGAANRLNRSTPVKPFIAAADQPWAVPMFTPSDVESLTSALSSALGGAWLLVVLRSLRSFLKKVKGGMPSYRLVG